MENIVKNSNSNGGVHREICSMRSIHIAERDGVIYITWSHLPGYLEVGYI